MSTRRLLNALISGRLTLIVRKDHTKWDCTEKVGHNDQGEPLEVGVAALTEDETYLGMLARITKGINKW
ncbi:hypothetical protein DER46DRAFT_652550 [Fusarium sp. MPI-SDFR-AT-0072]|nr:hypothetical protein DER46DRAFT_652550 [Fusarium sp. MPI-SDFR-AT-0072]